MSDLITELVAKLESMDPDARAEVDRILDEKFKDSIWISSVGPQQQAELSRAEYLLYGGSAGGGKSDLLCGLALTQHTRSLILRPQYTDLSPLIERVTDIAGTTKGLNKSPPAQFRYGDHVIDFGAAIDLDAARNFQGSPHSLLGFDEGALFSRETVSYLQAWCRVAEKDLGVNTGERARTILASNPPLNSNGMWLLEVFRPWLDPTHENPAEAGELRWFVTNPDGDDMEVDGADDIKTWTVGGRETDYKPKSRTFIPASLSDNPFLINTGYQSTLDSLPEPMRSAMRDGSFLSAREDDVWQVIPTNWVLLANQRWRDDPRGGQLPLDAIGLDVARGGKDATVLSPRRAHYFDEQLVVPGRDTPDGPSVAALVAARLRDGAVVGVDNIGVGADAETALKMAGLNYEAMNGSETATTFTRDGSFAFLNKRAEMWWMLREALDPDYGYGLALPPDQRLLNDLTSPTYEVRPGQPPKIQIEGKREMIKRLGRSPDRGDSLVYAWNCGNNSTTMVVGGGATPKKILGSPPPQAGYDVLRF